MLFFRNNRGGGGKGRGDGRGGAGGRVDGHDARGLVQSVLQHAGVQGQQGQEEAAQVDDGRLVEEHPLLQQEQLEEGQRALLQLLDEAAGAQADVELLSAQHVVAQTGVQIV